MVMLNLIHGKPNSVVWEWIQNFSNQKIPKNFNCDNHNIVV
jgi:hypothetical protein